MIWTTIGKITILAGLSLLVDTRLHGPIPACLTAAHVVTFVVDLSGPLERS